VDIVRHPVRRNQGHEHGFARSRLVAEYLLLPGQFLRSALVNGKRAGVELQLAQVDAIVRAIDEQIDLRTAVQFAGSRSTVARPVAVIPMISR